MIYKSCFGVEASYLDPLNASDIVTLRENNKCIRKTFRLKFFFEDEKLIKRGQYTKEDLFHISYKYTIINELHYGQGKTMSSFRFSIYLTEDNGMADIVVNILSS